MKPKIVLPSAAAAIDDAIARSLCTTYSREAHDTLGMDSRCAADWLDTLLNPLGFR